MYCSPATVTACESRKYMGKVPQSRYTMGLSIPTNLLSIPSIPLSSNCIVVKRFAHAH